MMKPMEDENNLNVGNTTSGEGSTEMESRGHMNDGYDKRGFNFGGYSSELLRAIENSVEMRHSSPSLNEDGEVSSSNEDESQQGCAMQMVHSLSLADQHHQLVGLIGFLFLRTSRK